MTNYAECWQDCGGTGTLVCSVGSVKMVKSLWKTVWSFFKKKKHLIYDPASLLFIYPKGVKDCTQTETST